MKNGVPHLPGSILRAVMLSAPLPMPPCLSAFDWSAPDPELRATTLLAHAAATDPDFEWVMLTLRLCMGAIPSGDRARLQMPAGVWLYLCPPRFLEAIAPGFRDRVRGSLAVAVSMVGEQCRCMTENEHFIFEVICGARTVEMPQ